MLDHGFPSQLERLFAGTRLTVSPSIRRYFTVPGCDSPLLRNLARGFYWQSLIDGGAYANIKALAEAIGIDSGVVARATRLTLLSTKIIHNPTSKRRRRGRTSASAVAAREAIGGPNAVTGQGGAVFGVAASVVIICCASKKAE